MTTVKLKCWVVFGKCDVVDWNRTTDLEGAEEAAYLRAKQLRLDLNQCEELKGILDRVYKEIEEEEIQNGIEFEDEFVMECLGLLEVDPDVINDLVGERDPHTLEFLGLTGLSEEALDAWDANEELDEYPLVRDFEEGFEPSSPYDVGWDLHVAFEDTPD